MQRAQLVRLLHATLGFLLFSALGPAAACSSHVTTEGSTGAGTSSATSCVPTGSGCQPDGDPCCDFGSACMYGTCVQWMEPSVHTQCMCDGVAVGPADGCELDQPCGLDGGDVDAGDGGASGCQCVGVTVAEPCP